VLKQAVEDFDFNAYVRALVDFCNEDLSAFFFDIRKDSLYCDAADDVKRRAYRTVLDVLFHALIRYAAPVLVFTAEEVWQSRFAGESVHLQEWPAIPAATLDAERWTALRALRAEALAAIEPLRRDKTLGSSWKPKSPSPPMHPKPIWPNCSSAPPCIAARLWPSPAPRRTNAAAAGATCPT
jgi:isoleucyl-tRNA synthetase